MRTPHTIKTSICIVFLSLASVVAHAQSGVQKESVRAPENIKIDGKTPEWPNNKLQVYNADNKMSYTVSNDDQNLYLTLRTTYFYGSAKVIRGGVTFTVTHTTDKKARQKATDYMSVTFPCVSNEAAGSIISSINDYQPMGRDTVRQQRAHDSLVRIVDAKTTAAIKEFKISGFKDISDNTLSIYNTTGIKAMGTFNRAMAFVLEMAIPLKDLGLSVNDATPFSYNIRLEVPDSFKLNEPMDMGAPTSVQQAQAMEGFAYLRTPTDFWGEYTLAKKP